MKETSPFPFPFGLSTEFRLKGQTVVWWAQLEYVWATVTYDGAILYSSGESVPTKVKDVPDGFGEIRTALAVSFPSAAGTTILPFVGIAGRWWKDDLSEWTYGYKRSIRYTYTPIGIEMAIAKGERLTRLAAEYDHLWRGRVDSRLSDLEGSQGVIEVDDAVNEQTRGYGLRVSIEFIERHLPTRKHAMFAILLFVRYWDIDASDVDFYTLRTRDGSAIGAVVEPANTTLQIGASGRLGWWW